MAVFDAITAAAKLFIVLPFNETLFSQHSCLSNSFHGLYHTDQAPVGLFQVSPECLDDVNAADLPALTISSRPELQHVWLERENVELSLLREDSLQSTSQLLDSLWALVMPKLEEGGGQQLLQYGQSSGHIVDIPGEAMLLGLPRTVPLEDVEKTLPRFWKYTVIPETPSTFRSVSDEDLEPLRGVLKDLRFNPDVAAIVNNISLPQIHNDIRFLTGEDGDSGILSRHSFSSGARTAANWIKKQIEGTGAKCRFETFLPGFAPNVICRYAAVQETNKTVIISGHYDSRGSFGSLRAPGADDDGSGTTGILSIARTIGRKRLLFHSNVELITFAGEEQGLLGSRNYARYLRDQNATIALMIQADMTAYRAPQEPMQLGLPISIGTPEATQLVANISQWYSPELTVGYSGACCSDHQSFFELGFPATQVFERAGPIADPMYHNSGDLSEREGYDFNQLYAIAKVQFASLLHVAGFQIAQYDD